MGELTQKEVTKSLELARYCVDGISTLAKQGCIAAALVEAKEGERARVVALLIEARAENEGGGMECLVWSVLDDLISEIDPQQKGLQG